MVSHFALRLMGLFLLLLLSSGVNAQPVDTSCPAVMPIGDLGLGVAAIDEATGSGWLMWSEEPVQTRFSPTPHSQAARHVIAVTYQGGNWFFDNNLVLTPFTPASSDCLIAEVDFGLDTATPLVPADLSINGIDTNHSLTGLDVIPNQWNGGFNDGEWGVVVDAPPTETGCPAVMPIGDLGFGVAAIDEATGPGWLMWSEQPVHTRFSPTPHDQAASHVIAVTYEGGNWFFDNNLVLTPFTPVSSDCLIAEVDFGLDTAMPLVPADLFINGIDTNHSLTGLEVFPNQWNGGFNDGEWGVAVAPPPIGVGPALSKSAVALEREVSYLITLQNIGSDELDNIVLVDDLDAVFGVGNYSLSGAPVLVQNPGSIVLNPSYTGSGAGIELFDSASSTLAAGDEAIVRVTVNVDIVSDMGFGPGVYSNQATVTADVPSGTGLSDSSVNGNDVDPNGDGVPDEESQTVVTLEDYFIISGVVFDDNGASATAHDGVQDGVEAPRAGVSVELRDENGVLIDTVRSNSDGSYFFQVPMSVIFDPGCSYANAALNSGYGFNAATGTPCVPVTHPDYGVVDLQVSAISTAGYQWVSEGFLPNVAGTVAPGVVTDGTVEFSLDGKVSDSYFINFGSVRDSNWLNDQVAENSPDTAVLHSHSYRAFSDGIVDFTYTNLVSTPQNSSFSAILYHDVNCDGSLDSSEPGITAPISIDHEVNPEICVVNRVFIPSNVSHDDSYRTEITATMTYSDSVGTGHGVIHSVTITDITRAISLGEGVLVLEKFVENVTEFGAATTRNSALPDSVLRYTINFQNNGTGAITEVVVMDSTPAYSTLEQPVQCPGTLPDGIVSCQVLEPSGASNLAGYEGSVQWQFVGALSAGAMGSVSYDIRIE